MFCSISRRGEGEGLASIGSEDGSTVEFGDAKGEGPRRAAEGSESKKAKII